MKEIGFKSTRKAALSACAVVAAMVLMVVSACGTPKKTETVTEDSAVTTNAPVTAITTAYATLNVTTTVIPRINAPIHRSAAVYCIDTKEMLYTDNIDAKTAPASLTKLLTAATALKYVDPDKVFMVGSEQYFVDPYSSLSGLYYGNELSMYDLITGMLMASGNDAAYTVAVSTAREVSDEEYMEDDAAIEYFCKLMNDLAKEIGMENSHFTNPDGWDDEKQYTTADDLIKLAEYTLNIPQIAEIVATQEIEVEIASGEPFYWVNSNLLLDQYSEYYCKFATGMKTGTTLDAGNSLIGSFEKNGKKYITIAEGCETDEERYELTLKLFKNVIDKQKNQ